MKNRSVEAKSGQERPRGLGRWEMPIAVIAFILLVFVTFPRLLSSSWTVEAGDQPPVVARVIRHCVSTGGGPSTWSAFVGYGQPGSGLMGDFTALFYLFLPPDKVTEGLFAFSALLAALFFFLFLVELGCGRAAAFLGALSFGLSPSLVSFCYAGHIGRFTVLAYGAGALWLMSRAIRRRSLVAAAFGGLFVGYTLLSQLDVGVIFMLMAGPFWILELVRACGRDFKVWMKSSALCLFAAVVAFFVVGPAALGAFSQNVAQVGSVIQDDSRHWEWATQWSLPRQEAFRLVCGKYFGLDSWNQEAPYWGGIGRTEGWEASHQGMRNFTQTNEYLGVAVVILAFSAILAYGRRRERKNEGPGLSDVPADTVFWAVAALLGLLLCFGKHFPLYRLFYSLPYMSSFRNPVKFIVVVHTAVSVLAAYGMMHVVRGLRSGMAKACWPMTLAAGMLALLFLSIMFVAPWASDGFATHLQTHGFQGRQEQIVGGMKSGVFTGLLLAVAILCAGGLCLVLAAKSKWIGLAIVPALIGLVALDSHAINRRYVRYYDVSNLYASNAVIDFLKEFPRFRTKFIPPNWGMFGHWTAGVAGLEGVRVFDNPNMSRPPADLEMFYEAMGENPYRLWQLSGVRFLVCPREMAGQVLGILGEAGHPARAFDFYKDASGNVVPQWSAQVERGQFVVIENTAAIPTPTWFGNAEWMSLKDAASKMKDPAFDPEKCLLLDAEAETPEGLDQVSSSGICSLVSYDFNEIRMTCRSTAAGWVFVNDYYSDDWEAAVDGKPAPVVRANGIFRAVPVGAGEHRVDLKYRPRTRMFWIPVCLTLFIVILAGGASLVSRLRRRGLCGAESEAR